MTVVERRVVAAIPRVGEGQADIVAEEIDLVDRPALCLAPYLEQALSGRNQQCVAHCHPPDSAW
jgi:hypothetical protein